MVKVYLIRYVCPHRKNQFWFPESLDFKVANELCKVLAKAGKQPILFTFRIKPSTLKRNESSRHVYV